MDLKSAGSRHNVDSYAFESNLKGGLNIRETPQHKLSLQFNERNLIKIIDLDDKLSAMEKEELTKLIRAEKAKYHERANQRFDSKLNWSIMIKPACNDERNEIMRKFKY